MDAPTLSKAEAIDEVAESACLTIWFMLFWLDLTALSSPC